MVVKVTKLIALSDDAYAVLARMKHGGESFSKLVMRLFGRKKKKDIMEFAGIWKDRKDFDEAFKEVARDRKHFKLRDFKW